MRTTLTLDPDVAVLLQRLQREREASLKSIINEALRRGLKEMTAPRQPRKRFQTRPMDLGTCRLESLDNIAEVLAIAEGENFR
jgi:hypothetical protein